MSVPIPLTVIGGYLGAGKTTLLNHLLRNAGGLRLALLINDFGAINIDADLIASKTEQQINLTNGCVCCGLSAGFDEALDQLLEGRPPPDHIILEASGVADVKSISGYGHRPGLRLDSVIVVADAETVRVRARDKYVASTVVRQLTAADLIVLNKTDLVDAATLKQVVDWLEELVHNVRILTTSRAEVALELLIGTDRARLRTPGHRSGSDPDRNGSPSGHSHPHENHHPQYLSFTLECLQPCSMLQAETFAAELASLVLRAKGYLHTTAGRHLLQLVGRRWSLEPAPLQHSPSGKASQSAPEAGTCVVVIGLKHSLSAAALEDAAAKIPGMVIADPSL